MADLIHGLAIAVLFLYHCCPIWVVAGHYFPKSGHFHFPKSFFLVVVVENLAGYDCIDQIVGCQKKESLAMEQLLESVLKQENMAFEILHNMGHIEIPLVCVLDQSLREMDHLDKDPSVVQGTVELEHKYLVLYCGTFHIHCLIHSVHFVLLHKESSFVFSVQNSHDFM